MRLRATIAAAGVVCVLVIAATAQAATWTRQSIPAPAGAQGNSPSSVLAGVSCASSSFCVAVGAHHGAALIERWDGVAWTIMTAPGLAGASDARLSGVSCASSSACVAVGSDTAGQAPRPLVERWDGTSWSLQTVPDPSGDTAGALSGVSCSAADACTAVGSEAEYGQSIAERWNGATWSVQPTPDADTFTGGDPRIDGANFLSGVSCPTASSCSAVGTWMGTDVDPSTMVESWDGGAWTVQYKSPLNFGSPLKTVACATSTSCVAAGAAESGGPSASVVGRWDGAHWTFTQVRGSWYGVSCAGGADCVAVGDFHAFQATGTESTLAEHWDGSRWTVEPAPLGAPDAVSCPDSGDCEAVGATRDLKPFAMVRSNGAAALTIGYGAIGPRSSAFSSGVKRVNRYLLPRAGRLLDLRVYLQPRRRRGSQSLRGIVYADLRGRPGRLRGVTRTLVFHATDRAGWYRLTFSRPLRLRRGRYWLGILAGGRSEVTGFRFQQVRRARALNVNRFRGGPTARFGRAQRDSVQMSLVGRYRPGR